MDEGGQKPVDEHQPVLRAGAHRPLPRPRQGGRTARQREKSFDRKKDAVDFATKVENDKRENIYIDPTAGRVSVRQYATDWVALKVASAGTLESYERIMRLHVVPHLGNKSIAQVTAADVEGLYARWRQDGASLNTIESRRVALSGMFSHAVRHKRIANSPVSEAEKLDNPVIPVDEKTLPSTDEISAIAREIGPRLEPAIWLMACCGLRIGESLVVFPEDFFDGNLRLRRQVVRVKNEAGKYAAMYAPLKHRKEGEWRDIPAAAILDPLQERLPILNANGKMTHTGLVRKSWDRAIRRLGLPEYNPHDLRKKWATETLTNGASLHEVARWLGHYSVNLTAALYGHLTQDGRERCRQIIQTSYAPHMPPSAPAPAASRAELVLS
ncbi:tyrosine-type recombinase/integrase [Streptomyces sp. XD-27]|uniref:tyrosine-type recombinase/integrase n=1 Tax=Streptomyces sp. XD-27 TaxID=3062779 RepID=UPI0026F4474A|nr:tyrosine-type recombinase/integrase [Streptomyces sp. XD-27]WKX74538.1 tyrosine-type recombinase/integrase [Streptomyces sp. XD-27]